MCLAQVLKDGIIYIRHMVAYFLSNVWDYQSVAVSVCPFTFALKLLNTHYTVFIQWKDLSVCERKRPNCLNKQRRDLYNVYHVV